MPSAPTCSSSPPEDAKHVQLDRVPLWNGNHVSIKQLTEYSARYLYLPRLRDENVLFAAIQEGVASLTWHSDTFAYAEGWDEVRQRYQGLRAAQNVRVLADERSVLVKPAVAAAQIAADRNEAASAAAPGEFAPSTAGAGSDGAATAGGVGGTGGVVAEPPPAVLRRFHASVKVDPLRLGRDAARIAEEVVQHLTGIVGANVEITVEISADLPQGASEKTVRDVTENCRTLRFTDYGFEER